MTRFISTRDMLRPLIPILCAVLLSGCDADKVARLEKQNQDLKAQIQKLQAGDNLESQSKCARDARIWFNENWRRDKGTRLLDYTNHYNKGMNKCFILVERHYSLPDTKGSWMNNLTMWDVYENSKYAQFDESHVMAIDFMKVTDEIINCDGPSGNKCKSVDQFNKSLYSYMTD